MSAAVAAAASLPVQQDDERSETADMGTCADDLKCGRLSTTVYHYTYPCSNVRIIQRNHIQFAYQEISYSKLWNYASR